MTADTAALCIRSGNAVILRGGREALCSNQLTVGLVREALAEIDLNPDVVQLVQTTDRSAVTELLKMDGSVHLCIPVVGNL